MSTPDAFVPISDSVWGDKDSYQERNTCTVWTTAQLLDYTFEEAYLVLHDLGRKYGRGVYFRTILMDISEERDTQAGDNLEGHKLTLMEGDNFPGKRPTVAQTVKKYPQGKYFVFTKGHVFALIDGVVYDSHHSPRRRVYSVFRLEPRRIENERY